LNGFYKFSDVILGLYTVVGANLSTDYNDFADSYDSVGNCDPQDDGSVVVEDGNVSVKLNADEEDGVINGFVDKLKKRFISGGVTDDQGSGNKFACAMINLKLGGAVVDTRSTWPDGTLLHRPILFPRDYIVDKTNPFGFPLDVWGSFQLLRQRN
jgi:hypothetical protein